MSDKIIKVKRLGFPWETQDPFLFCVYHRDEFPKGNSEMGPAPEQLRHRNMGSDFIVRDGWRMYHGCKIPGFPYHPHRGFETITINKEGVVDHTDSLGAAGRFMEGDVQWMTAGKGVQHSEMFPLVHEDKENPLEIFQIWLNLPKASKMVEPHFKMLWKEDIPVVEIKDEQGKISTIDVVAGQFNDTKALEPTPDSWAADPNNAVGVFTIKMEAGAKLSIPKTAEGATRTLFFYKGDTLTVEGREVEVDHLVKVKPEEELELVNGSSEGFLLMLQGKPIGEPVVQHGPFVMNTREEIQQAFDDFRRTQFGGWPWPETEQAHDRHKGRFALHADGREEVKG